MKSLSKSSLDCFDGSYTCSLSNDLQIKAQRELHEKTEWRKRDVEALRQMIQRYHAIEPCVSDSFLLRFLRARKYDYDRALKLLLNYYAVRNLYPEIFRALLPSTALHILDDGVIAGPLPGCDYHGRKVLVIRAGNWNPCTTSTDEQLRALMLTLEALIAEEAVQVNGISVIVDMSGVSTSLALQQLKPSVFKKFFHVLQDAFPCRVKAIHFLHEPSLFSACFTIMKHYMKDKLRQRLHFHGSQISSLLMHFDEESLPSDLGGLIPLTTFSPTQWTTFLMDHEEYFYVLCQFGYKDGNAAPVTTPESSTTATLDSLFFGYRKLCINGAIDDP